jgi:hypothetical protein
LDLPQPLPSIKPNIRDRIEQQSFDDQLSRSPRDLQIASSTPHREDEVASLDISVPSTYSTIPVKKKEKLSMTNLYIERIFRGFQNKNKAPTVTSGILLVIF